MSADFRPLKIRYCHAALGSESYRAEIPKQVLNDFSYSISLLKILNALKVKGGEKVIDCLTAADLNYFSVLLEK